MPGEFSPDLNVLVIDDQPVARDMVRAILRSAGFSGILVAEDASQAEVLIRQKHIDLIICDWNMPGMTGLDFLQMVRSISEYRSTPFIMLTAEASRESVESAISSGVSDYLVKPFTADTLLAKVRTCMKSASG